MIPKTPIPNMALTLLENSEHEDLLGIFETCLKKRTIRSECVRLADAWRVLFSGMHLSGAELVEEMQAADHKLGVPRQRMLCEFIKADCASGGRFVLKVIKEGGVIDRAALIMVADLKDLAGVVQDGTPAIHLLATSCDMRVRPTLIRKAGTQLLSSVFDRNGMPVLYLIFGMGNISRFDLEAIAEVFSKEDLKKTMVQSRLGRNALEVFNELSTVLGMNKPRKQRSDPAGDTDKTLNKQKPPMTTDKTDSHPPRAADLMVDAAPALNAASPEAIMSPLPEVNVPLDSPPVPSPKAVPASAGKGDVRSPDNPGFSHAPVTIPKVPAGRVKKAKPKRPSTLPIPKAIADTKILVVDDDEIIRNIVKLQLHELGYAQCTLAESGNEAVKLAKEIIPDFIFMEICMPGEIDGIDAAREIRKHINTRIIFLTNRCDSEIVKRAGEVNPEGYILKPYTTENLRVLLQLRK
jgi:CheY-like chemotaxis protein